MGRGLRKHLEKKKKMAKTKEKFELINDILPAIAKKSAQILDKPVPNLAGSITKIMSAVICESNTEWNKESKAVDVSIKIYNYTARARAYTILATWPEKSGGIMKNNQYGGRKEATVEPTSSIGRGGAGAYFYEGGRLLVACGGGGASGWESGSNGGHGGGAGVPGRAGSGRGGGEGGQQVNTGELPASGSHSLSTFNFGSGGGSFAPPGGKVESCTTGTYWRNQGISPCEFMGLGRFRNNSGTEITNTSNLVNRGYKADSENYGYRHNGGNSVVQKNGTFIGGGGSGAYGGQASGNLISGGGGGSGYSNGSVTILETQLGGNENAEAFCLIELYTE